MTIAARLQNYIARHDVAWNAVAHWPSTCCMDAAHRAQVAPDRVAKAVLLEDDYGYVIAVIPADRRLDLDDVRAAMERDLRLADEGEIASLFPDCEPGALPPIGEAYGIATVWDPALGDKPEVYFEGGDHVTLVHMTGTAFSALMNGADRLPQTLH